MIWRDDRTVASVSKLLSVLRRIISFKPLEPCQEEPRQPNKAYEGLLGATGLIRAYCVALAPLA